MLLQQTMTVQIPDGRMKSAITFFVQKANSFSSRITVSREENRINAKSLLGLLSLELEQGTSITIAAEGADAAAALAALADIMEGRF